MEQLQQQFQDFNKTLDVLQKNIESICLSDFASKSNSSSIVNPVMLLSRLETLKQVVSDLRTQMKQHIDEKEAFEKECQEIISSTAESLSKLRSATQLEPQESYYAALSKFGLEPEPTNPMLAPAAESNQRTNPLTLHEDDDRESTISAERSVASTVRVQPKRSINKKKSQMFSPISIDAFERIPTLVRGKIVTIESINKLYRTFWDHFNKSTNNPGDVMSVPKMVQLGLKINSKTGQSHLQTLEALGFIQIMSDKSIRWVR